MNKLHNFFFTHRNTSLRKTHLRVNFRSQTNRNDLAFGQVPTVTYGFLQIYLFYENTCLSRRLKKLAYFQIINFKN